MKIKECIDIVDNLKPNQYSLEDKVIWLSFLDQKIINDVLLTHEGYHGEYDNFTGYSADRTNEELIVPSPYDRLYIAYINMKIDETNGETARYNNSATMFNSYLMEYKKFYHKTHMPLSVTERRRFPGRPCQLDVSEAQLEQLKKLLYAELNDDLGKMLSDDRIYDIIMNHVYTHTSEFKGPKGDKGDKGDDGTGVTILGSYDTFAQLNENHPKGSEGDSYLVDGDLCVWSVIKSEWVNVGRIEGPQGERGPQGPQGIQGERGSDATVTKENIQSALGYTPANEEHAHSQYLEEEDISGKADVTYVEQLSNPNLLINGDFRNPINQEGATTHTGGGKCGYTLDQWCGYNPYEIEVVKGSHTKITSKQYDMYFQQFLENVIVNGETYTISACIDDNIYSQTFVGGVAFENDVFKYAIRNEDVCYVSLVIQAEQSINVKWVKLEQGSVATPFVPRLYGEELALCQRYYYEFNGRIVCCAYNSSAMNGNILFPVEMRIAPTYTFVNSTYYDGDDNAWYTPASNVVSSDYHTTKGTTINFNKNTDTTLSVGKGYNVSLKVKFDARIY